MTDAAERRIVVGVEGSGYARAALIWALEEAHHRDAVVEVVTCYSPTYVPAAPDLGYVPLDSFDLAAALAKRPGSVIDPAASRWRRLVAVLGLVQYADLRSPRLPPWGKLRYRSLDGLTIQAPWRLERWRQVALSVF